ncbi:MAG: type II toxin-antitoxin system VapB15 family antitoxin [Chitinophagaceae bacterium]|nr:hypothetical protein [Flavisolibacter sp.]
MKADLNISLTFRQILDLVRQLPRQQKIRLTKELEREGINTTLSQILQAFKTDILTQKMIDQEVEIVRQELYEQSQKH